MNEYLAAHLKQRRYGAISRSHQPQGQRSNRADIGCNIFSGKAIAAGGCQHQNAIAIDQFDRNAIHFRFDHIGDGAIGFEQPANTALELYDVVVIERIV